MNKTLKTSALAGLTSLALAGCSKGPINHFTGKFRGYNTSVSVQPATKIRTVIIKCEDPIKHSSILAGYDFGSGHFGSIDLNNVSINFLDINRAREDSSNYHLLKFANRDSLEVAYDSIIAQNRITREDIHR